MNPTCHKMCKDFNSGNELMKAIVSHNALVYYYLSQLIILSCNEYKNLELKEGTQIADQLLADTLMVFHRQVKFNKIALDIQGDIVLVNKDKLELFDYLVKLFLLIIETSAVNPLFGQNREFEIKLAAGKEFQKIYELKDSVTNTLHTFGCKDQQDKEEIFHESLLVFWKKLTLGEIGVYFTGANQKLENCRVFNRKFYQNSKLSTFITGISKNIFLNRTRISDYQVSGDTTSELPELELIDQENNDSDTPALLLFLFYRRQVEERKLRAVISILQYDCNLEDKEVRFLIGINNARIHSSRLRANFFEWYNLNKTNSADLLDTANDYLVQRELKKEKLNTKIRTIDLFQRDSLDFLDLNFFKEEFQTVPEFKQFYRIFKYVFYFTATGKPSALSGLPDEKMMRSLMEIYKDELFSLKKLYAILLLLYYGSDEPGETIISLLYSLKQELQQLDIPAESAGELAQQLLEQTPQDETALINEIYNANRGLFIQLSAKKTFVTMIYENESTQRAF